MKLPIEYRVGGSPDLSGATWREIEGFYLGDKIRQVERASIRAFMEKHRAILTGDVLDFGSGEQPYRDLVDGRYIPYDPEQLVPGGPFSAVICTQVLQYVDDSMSALRTLRLLLREGGFLVLAYATNWDVIETSDRWRFTEYGMTEMLCDAGFRIVAHELRAVVRIGNFSFPLGYGAVCERA